MLFEETEDEGTLMTKKADEIAAMYKT